MLDRRLRGATSHLTLKKLLGTPTGTVEVIPDRGADHRFSIRSPAAYESIGDGDALVERIRTWGPGALVTTRFTMSM